MLGGLPKCWQTYDTYASWTTEMNHDIIMQIQKIENIKTIKTRIQNTMKQN